jgi:hypothetical protein
MGASFGVIDSADSDIQSETLREEVKPLLKHNDILSRNILSLKKNGGNAGTTNKQKPKGCKIVPETPPNRSKEARHRKLLLHGDYIAHSIDS